MIDSCPLISKELSAPFFGPLAAPRERNAQTRISELAAAVQDMHATLLEMQSAQSGSSALPIRASPRVVRGAGGPTRGEGGVEGAVFPPGLGGGAAGSGGQKKQAQHQGGDCDIGGDARPFTPSKLGHWVGDGDSLLPGAVAAGPPQADAVERMSRTPPQSAMRRPGASHQPSAAGGEHGSRRGGRTAHWKDDDLLHEEREYLPGAAGASAPGEAAGGGRVGGAGEEEFLSPSAPLLFRPHQASTVAVLRG